MSNLLVVEDLVVRSTAGSTILDGVSVEVGAGESLGLVGESGSGKTTLAHAILGYARPGLAIVSGSVRIGGTEITGRAEGDLRALRGRLVSYVPQDPASALNPAIRIGAQIREMLNVHSPGRDGQRLVAELLGRVQLPTDSGFQRRFPHQLSGGQQQRVAIAIALACGPPLVVLDEPTTGLDVVTQSLILEEVNRLRRELDVALVYVSHDLAAVAAVTNQVAVMYAGHVVEQTTTEIVTTRPRHPYSRGLVASVPDHRRPRQLTGIPGVAPDAGQIPVGCPFGPRCTYRVSECSVAVPALLETSPGHHVRCLRWQDATQLALTPRAPRDAPDVPALLRVDALIAQHRTQGVLVTAVNDVSFSVQPGACVALVGESGSGKTTIARCVAGLHSPAGGTISLGGKPLAALAGRRTREERRRVQLISQNPYESLNPRHTIGVQVGWPARSLRGCSKSQSRVEAKQLLERVRLPARLADRYPGALSGGERQRVAIARALAAQPDLLVCDEITSALDVSVQAAVIDLLGELQTELGLALLFITHDLGVVASVADDVLVLEHGSQVETGNAHVVLQAPVAPYTQRLIEAAPSLPDAPTEATPAEVSPR